MTTMEIWKEDEFVAVGELPISYMTEGHEDPDGISSLMLFYFKTIRLSPIVTFAHLAGDALIRWLDGAYLHQEGSPDVGPVRYVHGRSEVMKGKHTVSSVLLAIPTFSREMSQAEWASCIPSIYKKFLEHTSNDRA